MNVTWCHCFKVGEIREDYAVLFLSAYLYGSCGQKIHTGKYFVYSIKGFRIRKEDTFNSAPMLFYDVK